MAHVGGERLRVHTCMQIDPRYLLGVTSKKDGSVQYLLSANSAAEKEVWLKAYQVIDPTEQPKPPRQDQHEHDDQHSSTNAVFVAHASPKKVGAGLDQGAAHFLVAL